MYRNAWTGLTEPQVVQGALECREELGWIRPEAVRATDGGDRGRTGRARGCPSADRLDDPQPVPVQPRPYAEWAPQNLFFAIQYQ
ncbi:MAG: hypothetical protein AUI36_12985 [Cyanobacteria bacterium 13_1_40CM_2_61_4]|nr:MAG: hypothetical protein AUI36_12985 [Cyanobacteria bacterium 13_1_40CM_2_61_4]